MMKAKKSFSMSLLVALACVSLAWSTPVHAETTPETQDESPTVGLGLGMDLSGTFVSGRGSGGFLSNTLTVPIELGPRWRIEPYGGFSLYSGGSTGSSSEGPTSSTGKSGGINLGAGVHYRWPVSDKMTGLTGVTARVGGSISEDEFLRPDGMRLQSARSVNISGGPLLGAEYHAAETLSLGLQMTLNYQHTWRVYDGNFFGAADGKYNGGNLSPTGGFYVRMLLW